MGITIPKIDESTDRGREGDLFIPAGKYYVKALEIGEQEKKDGSGTFVQAQYEIVDAEKEDGESSIGLRIFDIFSLGETALWKIAKFLDCCYAPTKFEGSEIPNDVEGKELVVRVAYEKYQGNENLRVKAYMDRFGWEGRTMRTDSEGNQIVEGGSGKPKGDSQVSV
jgi:hypothetical protein